MIQNAIRSPELNEIFSRLRRLFNIRITLFDLNNDEFTALDVKEQSAFCQKMRENPAFDAKCVGCDQHHLTLAKKKRGPLVYTCHRGLLEGIVPLYDGSRYFGSLVFGQVRAENTDIDGGEESELFSQLPSHTQAHLEDLAHLLKTLSQSIVRGELLRYQHHEWVQRLVEYIQNNLADKISITDLAFHIRRSESFVTHCFRDHFGISPRQYIVRERLREARQALLLGSSVKEAALGVGFYDEFHFSRSFKKAYGYSPSFLRR